MTTHRIPTPLVLLFGFASACYSPHDSATTTSAGDDEDSSGSDTGSDPATTAPTSTNPSDPTSDPTGESEASGPDSTADSTGDSGGVAVCGDGMVGGDEVCDDGINDGSYDGCTADCSALGPHCGDGTEQGDEVCDDGDAINGDGCNTNCIVSGSVLWSQTMEQGRALAVDIDDDDGVLVAYAGAAFLYLDVDGASGWDGSYSYPSGTDETPRSVGYHSVEGWIVAGSANTETHAQDAWWRPYSENGNAGSPTTYDNAEHTGDGVGGAAFDGSGRLYVFGSSNDVDGGQGYNVWLRKFDTDGEEMWTQPYDGGGNDYASAIAVTDDDYILVGGSSEVDTEGRNAWLRKYSPEGATEWQRTSAGSGASTDTIEDIATGADGAIAVIGNQSDDIWVRQYDSDGIVEWTDTYDGPSDVDCIGPYCYWVDGGNGIAIDSAGAVIAVGSQVSTGDGVDTDGKSTWVRKYDAAGNEMWTDIIDASGPNSLFQGAQDVVVTSSDDIVVVGTSDSTPTGGTALGWVQKYAP